MTKIAPAANYGDGGSGQLYVRVSSAAPPTTQGGPLVRTSMAHACSIQPGAAVNPVGAAGLVITVIALDGSDSAPSTTATTR